VSRELVQTIKAATWRNAAEAQQLAASADVDAGEILQVLDILLHKVLAADAERHALRRQAFAGLVQRKPDESLFRPFVRAMKSAPADVRTTLVELLPRVAGQNDPAELVDMLRAPEPELRSAAARALGEIGGKSVVTGTAQLLSERNFPGLRDALDVLARVPASMGGGGIVVQACERILTNPGDPADRALAARMLGDPAIAARSPAAAMRALALAARDPNEPLSVAAINALANVAGEADYLQITAPVIEGRSTRAAAAAIEGLKRFPGERTAAVLERKLASGPNALRFACLAVAEQAQSDALLSVVVKALGHPHLAVRNRASEVMGALARGGKVEVGRTLVWLLRSPDVSVRRMAADVLRSVPDPHGELWPKVVSSLRDDDWWVRERVMDALVELAGRGLSRYMVAWLADTSDVVRRFALSVLLRLKDPETIGALVHCALNDSDWWAREKAIEVIAEFRDARAVPTIVDIMQKSPELQLACIAALRHIDPTKSAAYVLPLASSPDGDVRHAVLKLVEELNDPAHAPVAAGLADDPDPSVQRLARAIHARYSVVSEADTAVPTVARPISSEGVPVIDGDTTPLDVLLARLVELGGDDLILASDRRVFMKKHGTIAPLTELPVNADRAAALLTPLLSTALAPRLEQKKDVDFSYVVKATGARFRVNLFRQRGGLSAVFHAVRGTVPVLEQLGLPPVVASWCNFKNGLVIVAGPTASGKSTTLAALLDAMNRRARQHIVSIEDPIEVLHAPKQSLVNQREVGTHTRSFAAALRSALREDPDVLMIGEMRDFETISLALTAAETGHLVFGTVNTISSDQAVERIINVFPRAQQEQARSSLADVLKAIVCQTLVRGKDGQTRQLAAEVLLNNEAIANVIRKGKAVQIPSIIATASDAGMQTLEQDLARLIKSGLVDADDAAAKVRNKRELEAARAAIEASQPAAQQAARADQERATGTTGSFTLGTFTRKGGT
jgi:twitching motility protein PilT